MVCVLSAADVEEILDIESLLPVVEHALIAQSRGAVERPERPHFPVGTGLDGQEPTGTAITMPAYIHGEPQFGTKLVSLNEENETRGLPTLHAQILLTDARTGVPEALIAGTAITNARTGCLGALGVRELGPDATVLGVLGAGAQARWQTRAIETVVSLEDVRIYSPSDSREACAADLRARDIPASAVESPREAVTDADVVVTATTSTEPVVPADAIGAETLVIAVGAYTAEMQELQPELFERASRVFGDVPAEVIQIGDLQPTEYDTADLRSLGEQLDDDQTADTSGITILESVGSAVLDAAAGQAIYEQAGDVGTELPLTAQTDR